MSWLSVNIQIFSTIKTHLQEITELLLKVALNTKF